MPDFSRTIDCSTAREFLGVFTPWTSDIRLTGYVFRGHADDQYELVPSALRPGTKEWFWSICGLGKPIADQSEWEDWQSKAEFNLLREFYKLADQRGLYVPNADRVRSRLAHTFDVAFGLRFGNPMPWLPRDLEEVAGLAQHYGVPTRLLDWSTDPYVSIYFAASAQCPGEYISVWMLDVEWLANMNDTVHHAPVSIVTPPYAGNPNLAAQAGLFTSWNVNVGDHQNYVTNGFPLTDRRPFDEALVQHFKQQGVVPDFREMFVKVRLPSEHCHDVLEKLAAAGYNAARIFPGYRGVAEEVMQRNKRSHERQLDMAAKSH
jgi:hypothetical protein